LVVSPHWLHGILKNEPVFKADGFLGSAIFQSILVSFLS